MSQVEFLLPPEWTEGNEKGIGSIARGPKDKGLIEGVEIENFALYPDDRGYFLEIARMKEGLVADYDRDETQVSAALSYSGTIKAFHYHQFQTDYWVPVQGVFQVGLVDLRPASPTFRLRNTIYCGNLKPMRIKIPPGIGHGYKVVSPEAGMLVYITNKIYNPADEGRIPYNDANINYDWETQYK